VRMFILAAALFALLPGAAEARHLQPGGLHPDCNVLWPCAAPVPSRSASRAEPRQRARRLPEAPTYRPKPERAVAHAAAPARALSEGLVAPLAAKVAEIVQTCGSRVVSAVRHTFIAGTRRVSLHSFGEAADVAGNHGCVYSLLHDWPGGYSIDAGRMGHVHISYEPGGREWGARFAHGGGRHRHGRHRRRKG
jgi:hypothetical protein